MKTQACLAFTALAIALTGAPATAATFSYELTDENTFQSNAGDLTALSTTFDDQSALFSWSSTFSAKASTSELPEGGWLVVNDGPAPKNFVNENVIFYLDAINDQVSAYNYIGDKKSASWETGEFLGTRTLDVTNEGDDRTLAFSWDMTSINGMTDTFGPEWKGTAFDDQIGIWFHAADQLELDYSDADGQLSKFDYEYKNKTIFDKKLRNTTVVADDTQDIPEPGMIMALGMTAAAAAFTKRRNAYA